MKKWILISIALIYLQSCAQQKVNNKLYQATLAVLLDHSVPEITVKEAQQKTDSALFLDARKLEEYKVSHIAKAKYVGYKNFSLDSLHNISKDTPIIVYCSVGYRSEKIAEKLISTGYTHVSNLYGGLFEWANHQGKMVKNTHITDSIHAYNAVWGKWITNKEMYKVYH